MAGKLLELKEAADKLGMSPDQLIEMRSRGEIYGYRDGGSWKFKEEEIERVLAERGDPAAAAMGDDLDELIEPWTLKIPTPATTWVRSW
jgi:excisionase family DNA binding protein